MRLEAEGAAGGPSFLQFGDLRLGAETDPRLRLPEDKRRLRRSEQMSVLTRLCALAVERNIDCILIPGDLLDSPVIGDAECDRLIALLADLAPRPVIIAPGERDAWSPDSVWNPALAAARGRRSWPDNVHIFCSPAFECLRTKPLPEVLFVGRSHPPAESPEARLPARIERPAGGIQVLLHHGTPTSQKHACRPVTQPFTDSELLAQEFSYAALGHSGRSYVIRDSEGRIRAADAGCPAAVWPPTPGKRGAIIGRLTERGVAAELETVFPDERQLREVRADLSAAADGDEVRRRILAAASESGAEPGDLLHVVAGGLYGPGVELPVSPWVDGPYFHLQVDYSAARPDYDLENLRGDGRSRRTVERRFVAQMMEHIEAAADENQADLAETALNCGLDALRHGRLGFRG